MAYTKKIRKARRTRKKAPTTVKKLSRRVNTLAAQLKPELKVSESNYSGDLHWPQPAHPSEFMAMRIPDPGMTSGTSYFNERVGESIRIRSIQIKGIVYANTAGSSSAISDTFRIILVRWPVNVSGGIAAVLENTAAFATVSPYDNTLRKQFQILWDKTITVSAYGKESQHFSYFKKVNLPVNYLADGSTVVDGELKLFAFSTYPNSSSNPPKILLYSRIRYTDV